MAISVGEKVKIYVQTGDRVLDLTGLITSYTFTSIVDDAVTFEFSGFCLESPFWSTAKEIIPDVTVQEWKCPYCKRPNRRKDETCKSCGAVRPFIYG